MAATELITKKSTRWNKTLFQRSKPKQKSYLQCNCKNSLESSRFKETVNNFCHKTGHISPASLIQNPTPPPKKNRNQRTHNFQRGETVDEAAECESTSLHRLFNLQGNGRTNPLVSWVGINGHDIEMEIDTGTVVSLISHAVFENLWCEADKPKLWLISQKLAIYTGGCITPCGQVSVDYNGQHYRLPFVVVPDAGLRLLTKNWIQVVQLSLKCIH